MKAIEITMIEDKLQCGDIQNGEDVRVDIGDYEVVSIDSSEKEVEISFLEKKKATFTMAIKGGH